MAKDYCAPVVGLVGGSGSGKSALAGWISQNAPVEVIDGDQLGHQALQDSTLARTVLDRFPQASQDTNQTDQPTVDRKALAQVVFGNDHQSQAARNDLEAIVHPFIHRRLKDLIDEHHTRDDCEAILVDAAVMFEAGWNQLCDHVVFVDAPQALRLERVGTTRNWNQADYLARQSSQWPLEKKQDSADSSVNNSGSLEESGGRLLTLIHSLRGKASASCS